MIGPNGSGELRFDRLLGLASVTVTQIVRWFLWIFGVYVVP